MNPRERIATILFIEQIKHTKANISRDSYYNELKRKELRENGNSKNAK